jgi:hypothetical protein
MQPLVVAVVGIGIMVVVVVGATVVVVVVLDDDEVVVAAVVVVEVGATVVVVVGATVVVVVLVGTVVVVGGTSTWHRKGKNWHSSLKIRSISFWMLTGMKKWVTGQERVGKATCTAPGSTAWAGATETRPAEAQIAAAATRRGICFMAPPKPLWYLG